MQRPKIYPHILDATNVAIETSLTSYSKTAIVIAELLDKIDAIHTAMNTILNNIEDELNRAKSFFEKTTLTDDDIKQLTEISNSFNNQFKKFNAKKKEQLLHPIPTITTLENIRKSIEQLFQRQQENIARSASKNIARPASIDMSRFGNVEFYNAILAGNKTYLLIMSEFANAEAAVAIESAKAAKQRIDERKNQCNTRVTTSIQTFKALLSPDQASANIVSYATSRSILLPSPSVSSTSVSMQFDEAAAPANNGPKK